MLNILVVDDDKVDRLTVRELLSESCNVYEAASSEETRRCLENQSIDCVLLDYLIPGTDSLALLEEISAGRLPVVMLTGEGNENIAVSAMKHGALDYINKRTLSDTGLAKTITNAVSTIELRRRLDLQQQELVEVNTQLRGKVEALEMLTSDLENIIHITAHDLREPLKNLSCYCELLCRDIGTAISTRSREYVSVIQRSTRRLATMIDDLRALSHVVHSQIQMDTVALEQVIGELLVDFEPVIAERSIEVQRDPHPVVRAYKPLIVELYRNLLQNAVAYGAEDGLEIRFTCEQSSGRLVFGVRNSGTPIPVEEREKIFQLFYRAPTSANRVGSGVGLALCKKIVEKHGGKIWVESLDQGYVHFKFNLGGPSND